MERGYIERILNATHWKVSGPNGAASILGLKPTTLISRMKKLGIEKPSVAAIFEVKAGEDRGTSAALGRGTIKAVGRKMWDVGRRRRKRFLFYPLSTVI